MILSRFRKSADQSAVYATYASIVAQSRQAKFYADWQVPDTVTGRFDMISLHLAVLLRRLKTGEAKTRNFSQSLFDLFFKDMDRSLREMGAGDMAVPKRIQKMGELFYGLLAGVTNALENADDEAMAALLRRNVFSGEQNPHLEDFSSYVRIFAAQLQDIPDDTILDGTMTLNPVS